MKWNFLYQITAAPRTPDWGATAPRSPILSVLNWVFWKKIPGYATECYFNNCVKVLLTELPFNYDCNKK